MDSVGNVCLVTGYQRPLLTSCCSLGVAVSFLAEKLGAIVFTSCLHRWYITDDRSPYLSVYWKQFQMLK